MYTGREIARIVHMTAMNKVGGHPTCLPAISIHPFIPEHCGPNSYDVRLGPTLLVYKNALAGNVLDMKKDEETLEITIPDAGIQLNPGILYLGHTVERFVCSGVAPELAGRSSVGRLGIEVHCTAGFGDDGFGEEMEGEGGSSLTFEIQVIHPIIVYHGIRIAQINFERPIGERTPYRGRYRFQADRPVGSLFAQRGGS